MMVRFRTTHECRSSSSSCRGRHDIIQQPYTGRLRRGGMLGFIPVLLLPPLVLIRILVVVG